MNCTLKVLIILLFEAGHLLAQSNSSIATLKPSFVNFSPTKLRVYLKELPSEEEKSRSIFLWISHNIKYDLKRIVNHNEEIVPIKKILQSKKADMHGYANLFHTLCGEAGLKSFIIPGYLKPPSLDVKEKFYTQNHFWNAFKVEDKWFLVDLPFSAGAIDTKNRGVRKFLYRTFKVPYLDNKIEFRKKFTEEYFKVAPESFVTTHLPTDSMWQLLTCPVPMKVFEDTVKNSITKYLITRKTDGDSCINFDQKIDRLITESLLEQVKITGENSYRFANANNRILANAYFFYGANLIGDYANYDKINKTVQKERLKEGQKYIVRSLPYYKNFKRDNKAIQAFQTKKNEKRHKLVMDANKKFISENNKNLTANSRTKAKKEIANEKIDKNIEKLLLKSRAQAKYASKGGSVASRDTQLKNLKVWGDSIVYNAAVIKSLSDSISVLEDMSSSNYRLLFDMYSTSSKTIQKNINAHMSLQPDEVIEEGIAELQQIKKGIAGAKKDNAKIKSSFRSIELQMNKASIEFNKLVVKFENVVKQMNLPADAMPQLEMINNHELKALSLSKEREYNKLDLVMMRSENKWIKNENKLLSAEGKAEGNRFAFVKYRIDYRYKLYEERTDKKIEAGQHYSKSIVRD
ncbi:MAG TPA: transglutaminase domain-containing protein [Cytophagaceae bacterium]